MAVKKLLAILLLLLAAPASLRAEDDPGIIAPTSGWLVGPVGLVAGDDAASMPCLAANQFANGYFVRFSGGGGKILAMAVDTRRAELMPGESYALSVRLDDSEPRVLPALAYDPTTLILNLEQDENFYADLGKTATLGLRLGEQDEVPLALLGLKEGLARMETCHGGTAAAPAPARAVEPQPVGFRRIDVAGGMPDSALPAMPPKETAPSAEAMPAPEPAPVAADSKSLEQRLRAAAASINDPATEAPPAEAAAVPEVVTTVPPSAVSSRQAAEAQPRDVLEGAAPATADSRMRWRAIRGANLRSILEIWSKNAQVQLVWSAGQDYSLPESLVFEGTFDEALEKLLSVFPDDDTAPSGHLYRDQETGRNVLIIRKHQG